MAIATSALEVESAAIEGAGLSRVEVGALTIARIADKDGFTYKASDDRRVTRRHLHRIAELTIPPAWTDVRIAYDDNAHLQVVGRDDAGRLQYIYHEGWEEVRTAAKAFRLSQLLAVLSRLRHSVDRAIKESSPDLPFAAATRIVDLLHLRAGHENYAGDEGGRGVATLLKRHVQLDKDGFRLRFRGKGGKKIDKYSQDPKLLAALCELKKQKGPRLFTMKNGEVSRAMTAADLNRYLAETAGAPITAKDFRTLYASATALDCLQRMPVPQSKRRSRSAIREVAVQISSELANTPAITRKSYIHPSIIEAFENAALKKLDLSCAKRGLKSAEAMLQRFLEIESR